MVAMAEGAGDALSVSLVLLPELVGPRMTGLAFRGTVRRVTDKDEGEIDDKK